MGVGNGDVPERHPLTPGPQLTRTRNRMGRVMPKTPPGNIGWPWESSNVTETRHHNEADAQGGGHTHRKNHGRKAHKHLKGLWGSKTGRVLAWEVNRVISWRAGIRMGSKPKARLREFKGQWTLSR